MKAANTLVLLFFAGCLGTAPPGAEPVTQEFFEPSSIDDIGHDAYIVRPLILENATRTDGITKTSDGYQFDFGKLQTQDNEILIAVQVLEDAEIVADEKWDVNWAAERFDSEGNPGRSTICISERQSGIGASPYYINTLLGWNATPVATSSTGGRASTYWTAATEGDGQRRYTADLEAGDWYEFAYATSGVPDTQLGQAGDLWTFDLQVPAAHRVFILDRLPFICAQGTETSGNLPTSPIHRDAKIRFDANPISEVDVLLLKGLLTPELSGMDDVTIVIGDERIPVDGPITIESRWPAAVAGVDIELAFGSLAWAVRSTFHWLPDAESQLSITSDAIRLDVTYEA